MQQDVAQLSNRHVKNLDTPGKQIDFFRTVMVVRGISHGRIRLPSCLWHGLNLEVLPIGFIG
jgi:hypothetical protein